MSMCECVCEYVCEVGGLGGGYYIMVDGLVLAEIHIECQYIYNNTHTHHHFL